MIFVSTILAVPAGVIGGLASGLGVGVLWISATVASALSITFIAQE